MNSGELVKVSFPAIISRLTELPESTVLQLAAVIQFESGFEVSVGVLLPVEEVFDHR
jgi:hypothetical protein